MKKRIAAIGGSLALLLAASSAASESPINTEESVFVSVKNAVIYETPSETSRELATVPFGQKLTLESTETEAAPLPQVETPSTDELSGEEPVTWESVSYTSADGSVIEGFLTSDQVSTVSMLERTSESAVASRDGEILDFPGRKDGEVIGELLEYDEVERTASIGEDWSQILFSDAGSGASVGYIPTTLLKGYEDKKENAADLSQEESGELHEGAGQGVFAEANTGVTAEGGLDAAGVQIGTPVGVDTDASLIPLGTFRITHYCQCSICCGPYTNGITSTGVIATTNHTIAVDPTQIPYGSRVVINGQVYVAEDCGGAIKTNCIDIYVATHEEGEARGVYYTDVYLLK